MPTVYNRKLADNSYYSGPEDQIPTPPVAAPPTPPAETPRSVVNPGGKTYDEIYGLGTHARTIDDGASQAESYLSTFKAPETEDQIAERLRKQSAGLIDSTNKVFDDEVARKRVLGEERLSMDNAMSVLTGNAGGSESIHSRTKVLQGNEKEIQAVNNERAMALASVFSQISRDAREEARFQKEDATRSAQDILTRRKDAQTKAVESIKLIASSGLVDFDAFASNPKSKEQYKYALDAYGGSEEALRAHFAINRPRDQILGTPQRVGNKYVQAYTNPITGKVSYEQIALPFDLPVEYNSFQKMGDNLVAIPDGWDGDVNKLKTVVGQKSTMDELQEALLRKQLNAPDPAQKRDTQVVETADGRKVLIDTQTGEEISAVGGNSPANSRNTQLATDALAAIQSLETMRGQKGAIGAKGLMSLFGYKDKPATGSAASGYLAQLDRVKALLTLPNLQYMKGLGAMSDREFNTISASVAALNPDMKESAFNTELTRIKTALQTTVSASGGSSSEASSAQTAQVGTIVEIGGKQYLKTGEDDYEPI